MSQRLLDALATHAGRTPAAPAIAQGDLRLSYGELAGEVERVRREFAATAGSCLGMLMDNGAAWAVADLAALAAGITAVPLPSFFSDAQLRHSVADARMQALLTDAPERIEPLIGDELGESAREIRIAGRSFTLYQRRERRGPHPDLRETAKLTYTSGTTGNPKGVRLSAATITAVSESLHMRAGAVASDRHLAALPLSTLLENVGGIYVPLLAGAQSTLLPLAEIGLTGAASLDAVRLVETLRRTESTSVILTPQMLYGVVAVIEAGAASLPDLRYVAVGGATVPPSLLQRAEAVELPIFQGYGLSEAGSVVAVNSPQANRSASVGRPLPHASVRIAEDGEVLVGGSLFDGYLNAGTPALVDGYWPTGDIGHLDSDGYLYITGRKRDIFITSFGRNVSPDWVEGELTLMPEIAQAAVFGESRPFNVAVVVPRSRTAAGRRELLSAAIDAANAKLPDYARIARWVCAEDPFTPSNGQLTTNGRLRRDAIWGRYGERLQRLYEPAAIAQGES